MRSFDFVCVEWTVFALLSIEMTILPYFYNTVLQIFVYIPQSQVFQVQEHNIAILYVKVNDWIQVTMKVIA